MATAARRPSQAPVSTPGEPRAKPLRRREKPALRPTTEAMLVSFERVAAAYEEARIADEARAVQFPLESQALIDARSELMRAASRTTEALFVEHRDDTGALPDDLRAEIERWDEGQFQGTRADVEIANFAISELLGSDVRVELRDEL